MQIHNSLKILIDIGHPAHVHYFKNLINIMKGSGHQFLIIARDKEITHQLLKAYNMPYISRGKGSSNILGKIAYVFKADLLILKKAINFKPDILLSFGSPYAAHVSKLIHKPHIAITDTEHAKLGILAFAPFSKAILTPDVFTKDFGNKHIRFKSYIEFTYLNKKYFKPDSGIKSELGISENQKFVFFRFISWGASHDIGQTGIPNDLKKELVQLFINKGYKVLISSEGPLETFFEPFKINVAPEKIHSVLAGADFFIGESGTMATEAAILGTPSVFVNTLNAGVFEDEVKLNVLYSFRNTTNLKNKISELINDPELKVKHLRNAELLSKNKIDITAFLVWFIENYPNSLSEMKRDPEKQNTFLDKG